MICPQFKPIVGGYERSAERLSIALAKQHYHRVTVISEHRNSSWIKKENIEGVNIQRLWCIYKPGWHQLTSLMSFTMFLLKQGSNYQIWHIHQYGVHAVLAAILGKLIQRPVVLKITNSKNQGLSQIINDFPFGQILRYFLLKIDAVIALSKETREEAISFGFPSKRVHVIGNGVDTQLFHPCDLNKRNEFRKNLGIETTGIILYVGRLFKEKNPQGLLQAWVTALPRLPEGWKLVFVGDGPLLDELKLQTKIKKIQNTVGFAGIQDNVHEWLCASDIYVLPSMNEGLSNTLLEAMSCGKPVVSTLVSGVTEVLLDTNAGIVVEQGNMDEIANSIVNLVRNPVLQQKKGLLSRKVIENYYSIESVTNKYINLYLSLIK